MKKLKDGNTYNINIPTYYIEEESELKSIPVEAPAGTVVEMNSLTGYKVFIKAEDGTFRERALGSGSVNSISGIGPNEAGEVELRINGDLPNGDGNWPGIATQAEFSTLSGRIAEEERKSTEQSTQIGQVQNQTAQLETETGKKLEVTGTKQAGYVPKVGDDGKGVTWQPESGGGTTVYHTKEDGSRENYTEWDADTKLDADRRPGGKRVYTVGQDGHQWVSGVGLGQYYVAEFDFDMELPLTDNKDKFEVKKARSAINKGYVDDEIAKLPTKEILNTELAKKLDKIAGDNKAYVQMADGVVGVDVADETPTEGTIVKRGLEGRVITGNPVLTSDATNKYYVDRKVTGLNASITTINENVAAVTQRVQNLEDSKPYADFIVDSDAELYKSVPNGVCQKAELRSITFHSQESKNICELGDLVPSRHNPKGGEIFTLTESQQIKHPFTFSCITDEGTTTEPGALMIIPIYKDGSTDVNTFACWKFNTAGRHSVYVSKPTPSNPIISFNVLPARNNSNPVKTGGYRNIMINYGDVVLDYEPYAEIKTSDLTKLFIENADVTSIETYNIPSAIQQLPDYGKEGTKIDFQLKTYTHGNTTQSIADLLDRVNYIFTVQPGGAWNFTVRGGAVPGSSIIYMKDTPNVPTV